MTTHQAFSILATAFLFFGLSAEAQTDAVLPAIGGGGGGQFIARCNEGELLNGFDLRTGDDVDAIGPICIPAVAGQFHPYGTMFGGPGGGSSQLVCPNNAPVVTSMYVFWEGQETRIVSSIHLFCGVANGFNRRSEYPAAVFDGPKLVYKSGFGINTLIKDSATQDCPSGLVGVGINGRSGKWLDAVGLICGPPPIGLGKPLGRPTGSPSTPQPSNGASLGTTSSPLTAAARSASSNDFNGDGQGDILWHNSSTGASQVWLMSGTSRTGRATIADGTRPALIGPPWNLVGSRDFNGDGKTDLLWHNSATGETQIWHLNGNQVAGRATVVGETGTAVMIGLPWSIVGSNDMTGDGKSDIVWNNASTGETQVWGMNGYKVTSRATIMGEDGRPALVRLPWSVVGTGDFNLDGNADLLWHNGSTGETQIWYLNAFKILGRETVFGENGTAALVGLPWSIAGSNDFDNDGKADILWHNASTGEPQIWLMNGRSIIRRVTVDADRDGGGAMVGAPWGVVSH